ncbi:MAG: hypothetical protein K6G04_02610 [Lachnospiraceae bacterium]|nr:hypothetical protein [Lachnospiraceae bacterium]
MSFFTFSFVLFLIVLMIPYFLLPQRPRIFWLLGMNLVFVYLVGGWCMLLWLVGSILFSYVGGRVITRATHKKAWFVCFLLVELGCLGVLKLQTFVITNVNVFRGWLGMAGAFSPLSIAVPLGISFFMLQFISYLADVYTGRIEADTDFVEFACYGTFFPQVMSGPINRWSQMRDQFVGPKHWDWERILPALERIAWGFFKKLVIAERLTYIMNDAFSNYMWYSGFNALIGALACTIKLYADFSGYSDIAFGVAKMLDIEIIDNFRAPYMSTSIQDFWRRWHISLSSWLKDYVYIPLGGSRCSKLRKNVNLLLTFLVSGIWHGAGWNYIAWGLLHGVSQIVGSTTLPIRNRIAVALHLRNEEEDKDGMIRTVARMIGTFFLVMLLWVLFFSPQAIDGFRMIGKIFQVWSYNFSADIAYHVGTYTACVWLLLFASILVMFVTDALARAHGDLIRALHRLPWPVHLLLLWFIVGAITLSLNLSTTEFIYMKF